MMEQSAPPAATNPEADAQIHEGIRLAAAGHREAAILALEEGLQMDPRNAFGRLHMALVLAGAGRADEARSYVAQALELRPHSPAFRLVAGRIAFDTGDYAVAEAELRSALELSPANDLAKGYLALARWAGGNADAALELRPDALPDSTPFLARLMMMIERELKGHSVTFVDPNLSVPALDRLRTAYLLWRAGMDHKAGRFVEAAELADMVLELHPGHAGAVRVQQENRTAAVEAARRRVTEAPFSIENRRELASLLAGEEQFAEAEAQILEMRRLALEAGEGALPETPEMLRLRGLIEVGMGRPAEALALVKAGAETGFGDSHTRYLMGLCHLALGDQKSCVTEFEPLVAKLCWAVPFRLRELAEWRRLGRPAWPTPQPLPPPAPPEPPSASDAGT